MKKLIITADDYGMSPGVNQAIEEGIGCGLITSTNVMANMDYAQDAATLKQKFPNVSVGIHWTLSAGRPVSKPEEIPSLVNENGEFHSYQEFRKRYRSELIKEEEIITELKNQYEKFCEICGEPDYWNTHQNIHVDFKLFRLFVKCAKSLGISKMRSHQRVYIRPESGKSTMSLKWKILEPVKLIIINYWKRMASKNGMASPDGIVTTLNEKDRMNLEHIFESLNHKNVKFAEYVIHPAVKIDSEYFGGISGNRIVEYKQFTSDETKRLVYEKNIKLANFRDLKQKEKAKLVKIK